VPPGPSRSSQTPKLQNLLVSLPKLSLPPELSPQPTKKIKLEEKEGESSQNNANSFMDNKPLLESKCNVKVLPKSLKMLYNKVKNESPKERDALLAQLKEESNSSSEDIKLKLAKLESVLEGKLLLNIASHKLSEMLFQDKTLSSNFSVKQELEHFDEKPTAENLEIPEKLGKDVICSNNNNNIKAKQCCEKRSLVYETTCLDCDQMSKTLEARGEVGLTYRYCGTTSGGMRRRGGQHLADLKAGLEGKLDEGKTSHMLHHIRASHPGENPRPRWGMKMIKTYSTTFKRLLAELVHIKYLAKNPKIELLNQKCGGYQGYQLSIRGNISIPVLATKKAKAKVKYKTT